MEVVHLINIGAFGDQVLDDLGPAARHDRGEEDRLAVLVRDVDDSRIPLDDQADLVQVAGLDRLQKLLGAGRRRHRPRTRIARTPFFIVGLL